MAQYAGEPPENEDLVRVLALTANAVGHASLLPAGWIVNSILRVDRDYHSDRDDACLNALGSALSTSAARAPGAVDPSLIIDAMETASLAQFEQLQGGLASLRVPLSDDQVSRATQSFFRVVPLIIVHDNADPTAWFEGLVAVLSESQRSGLIAQLVHRIAEEDRVEVYARFLDMLATRPRSLDPL